MIERARQEEGFTLIELMIVIVILGVLAGIVLFAVGGITDRGTSAACKTDVSTIQTGVEAYFAKTGVYPNDLVPSLTDPSGAAGTAQFLKWDSSFTGSTSATGPSSSARQGQGYTVTYDPSRGLPTSASRQRAHRMSPAESAPGSFMFRRQGLRSHDGAGEQAAKRACSPNDPGCCARNRCRSLEWWSRLGPRAARFSGNL
jgi:prepilin-type N-terminal cleavage/methylation domain-containing protein